MNDALIFIGSIIIVLWGIAHLVPTKNVVAGFGAISEDNKKIITMENIAEGVTLIFLGALPALLTLVVELGTATTIVYLACAVMLLAMAFLTLLTGARTSVIWYKICPAVKTAVAVLYILGAML